MRPISFIKLIALLAITLMTLRPSASWADNASKANITFIEMTVALTKLEAVEDPQERLNGIQSVIDGLENIVTSYPSTELAVKLASGQSIGSVNLNHLKTNRDQLARDIQRQKQRELKKAAQDSLREAETEEQMQALDHARHCATDLDSFTNLFQSATNSRAPGQPVRTEDIALLLAAARGQDTQSLSENVRALSKDLETSAKLEVLTGIAPPRVQDAQRAIVLRLVQAVDAIAVTAKTSGPDAAAALYQDIEFMYVDQLFDRDLKAAILTHISADILRLGGRSLLKGFTTSLSRHGYRLSDTELLDRVTKDRSDCAGADCRSLATQALQTTDRSLLEAALMFAYIADDDHFAELVELHQERFPISTSPANRNTRYILEAILVQHVRSGGQIAEAAIEYLSNAPDRAQAAADISASFYPFILSSQDNPSFRFALFNVVNELLKQAVLAKKDLSEVEPEALRPTLLFLAANSP